MQGTWDLYISGLLKEKMGTSFSLIPLNMSCPMSVESNGNILGSAGCPLNMGLGTRVYYGQMKVDAKCQVTAYIKLDAVAPRSLNRRPALTIAQATLNPENDTILGIGAGIWTGADTSWDGLVAELPLMDTTLFIGTIQAVKRPR